MNLRSRLTSLPGDLRTQVRSIRTLVTPSASAHRGPVGLRTRLGVGAGILAVLLIGTAVAVAPRGPSEAEILDAYIEEHAQSLRVPAVAAVSTVIRDAYSATPGIATLAASGTNYDWAKLVLLSGGWPMADTSITVILRWMRQENGPDDWFNRNNPLNNGWGSGGGGGTGTYDNLVIAAQNAAEALHQNSGYAAIESALASAAPTEVIEQAIWASPWATGHYANGGHWSYVEVPVVKAPEGTW
jgi:hypothetical protein